MQRPDLDTLACVNVECQLFRHAGANNLVIRKIYGHDRIRLLRCRICGEEFSERRSTAVFNTKIPGARAEDVINHLGEGCRVRATARLVKVAKETVARLLRVTGRHAERFHDQHVHSLTPRALEFDEQWSGLDHGTGHLATLRSTLRLAVVDSVALAGDQRIAKSPQTSNEVSERKIAPPRLSHLTA